MSISKKVISAVTSAALLASLLATAVAPGALAADAPLTCAVAITTSPCAQVADGASIVTVAGAVTVVAATDTLSVTSNGVKFTAKGGAFAIASDGLSASLGKGADLAVADTLTLTAPAAVGSTTLEVIVTSEADPTTGQVTKTSLGTFTITWLATTNLGVSTANSTVKVVLDADACSATAVASPVQGKAESMKYDLCVNVLDGNGNPVANTANVSVSISPVGLVGASDGTAGNTQATNENTAAGLARFAISGSGLDGTGTITVSVTYNGTTTALGTKTVVFSGDVATVTATSKLLSVYYNGGSGAAVGYTAKDKNGNNAELLATAVSSDTAVFTIGAITKYNAGTVAGTVSVTCKKVGTATVTVKSGTIASTPVTVNCAGNADTWTVAFGAATVNPGGSVALNVKFVDANGLPAANAPVPTAVVNSGWLGAFESSAGNASSTATYLAPQNFGVATALVTATVAEETLTKSASITIGAPAAPVALGSTASTLGVAPPGGTWSTSTKVAKVGSFITWRFAAGVANAGKTIGVFLQTKDANGVWSAPVRFSARVADSSGNAYFSWKGTKAMWVSIRGGLGDARSTPPVQGRWQ